MHDRTPRDSASASWLEPLCPLHKPALRLLCFPHAGGSAQTYRGWQQRLSPEIGVCLVHLPGRGRRVGEPPFTRFDRLVAALADIVPSAIPRPYAFFGHSMGAIIAFELARELRRRHLPWPMGLFLAGRRAPTVSAPDVWTATRSEDDLLAELRALNGTPRELLDSPETRQLFLPVLKADFEMVGSYQYVPEEPLACPIVVYGGREDHHVTVESLQAWSQQTSAGCRVKTLPGGHFFVSAEPAFIDTLRHDLLDALHVAGRPSTLNRKQAAHVWSARDL